jgi:hypothetical protein
MQSEVKIRKTTILKLDEDEVKWLQDVMQNPINGQDLSKEHSRDRVMREAFWKALQPPEEQDNRPRSV